LRSSGVSVMAGATRNSISPERFDHSTKTLGTCHYLCRTTLDKDGVRVMAFANQGRHHYDTREAAEAWIAEARHSFEGRIENPESIEAAAVECYDNGDAKRTVFGKDDNART